MTDHNLSLFFLLQSIDPDVLYFTIISPEAKNVIKNYLSDLEKQQRCQIDLMKLDDPLVAIHGLTQAERALVKASLTDYIDKNYVIGKELPSPPITGLQMKYTLLKYGKELKELGKDARSCSFPFNLTKTSAFDISPNVDATIKVVGTPNAIMALENGLGVFINEFFVETFSLTVQDISHFPWCKRWEYMKQEIEDTCTSIVEFKIPRKKGATLMVLFAVYGSQSDEVAQIRHDLEEEAAAGVAQDKINLSGECIKILQVALENKELDFDDYFVDIECVEKDNVVLIKSLAITADTIDVVKAEIMRFIQHHSNRSEDILFPDLALYMVFISKSLKYYENSFSEAERMNVSFHTFRKGSNAGICLKGDQVSVSTMRDQIQATIKQIQKMMGTMETTIDPILDSAFTPTFKSDLYEKLLDKFSVEFRYIIKKQQQQNEVLMMLHAHLSSSSQKVNLSVCSGVISAQSTDVIVNLVKEDLQLVSGIAKLVSDEGGSTIQDECNQYIRQHGKVEIGNAMRTFPGRLNCNAVVHAVLPIWQGGFSQEKELLYTGIFSALELSESYGYSSVSLPALGCDMFNIPTHIFSELTIKAVRDYCNCNPQSSLTDIAFIISNPEETQAFFVERISSIFPSDSIEEIATSETVWLWENDFDGFSQYDAEDCERITYEFQQNRQAIFNLTINATLYVLNLHKMVQINTKTQQQRKIKMKSKNSTSHALWYWANDYGQLIPYKRDESATIEGMFSSCLPKIPLTIKSQKYAFDFKRMVQINLHTKHERKIRRKSSKKEQPVLPGKEIAISLYGPKINLESAKQMVDSQLRCLLKKDQIDLPLSLGKDFISRVKQVTQEYEVAYKMQKHQQGYILVIEGIKTDLAVKELQRYIIKQQSTSKDVSFPPAEWEPQSKTTELFKISKGSSEWEKVKKPFL